MIAINDENDLQDHQYLISGGVINSYEENEEVVDVGWGG